MNQIPMPMIPMPCVVSSILMELMPIEPIPIPMQSILMPCVVFCSGDTRYRYPCHVWHPLEVTGIYAADAMNQMPMAMIPIEPIPMPCVASSMLMQSILIPCVASSMLMQPMP